MARPKKAVEEPKPEPEVKVEEPEPKVEEPNSVPEGRVLKKDLTKAYKKGSVIPESMYLDHKARGIDIDSLL